ncbi:MAG: hypothetical protein H7Y86_20110 [Rhizobacter sp.]|nr:hypothetical protein [Ferruginibacter sp.]
MKQLLSLLFSTLMMVTASAYPITPRPLRKLVAESEYIIWGKVLKVGQVKQEKKADHFASDYALIQITETLQGHIKSDTIRVFFSSGMTCPAPGVFFEGEKALAFLDKKKGSKDYFVHALSYGVKHLAAHEDYLIYKDRITEMQAILLQQEQKICNETVLEWLVKCAEKPATRWEGTYELSPGSDFMSYYDRDAPATLAGILPAANRKRLFDALLQIDQLNYADMGLADIARDVDDTRLLEFLKSKLQSFNKERRLWEAAAIMQRIVVLTRDAELETMLEKLETIYFEDAENHKKESQYLLNQFILKMKAAPLKKSLLAAGENNA